MTKVQFVAFKSILSSYFCKKLASNYSLKKSNEYTLFNFNVSFGCNFSCHIFSKVCYFSRKQGFSQLKHNFRVLAQTSIYVCTLRVLNVLLSVWWYYFSGSTTWGLLHELCCMGFAIKVLECIGIAAVSN